jgi:hypothetical protein
MMKVEYEQKKAAAQAEFDREQAELDREHGSSEADRGAAREFALRPETPPAGAGATA